MSLKLVELQVALPRTHDASMIQEQLEQRSQHMQENTMINTQKEAEFQQKNVGKNEENKAANFENDHTSSSFSKQPKKQPKEKEEKQAHHPYKGNFVDFSG